MDRDWRFEMNARNTDIKADSGDTSERNEELERKLPFLFSENTQSRTEHWQKGGPCYKKWQIKNLAELYSSVLWTVELVRNETGYLVRRLLSSVKGVAGFHLTVYSKMQKE